MVLRDSSGSKKGESLACKNDSGDRFRLLIAEFIASDLLHQVYCIYQIWENGEYYALRLSLVNIGILQFTSIRISQLVII